jgi:3-hydroxybutyryl-CoA dehydrogenase
MRTVGVVGAGATGQGVAQALALTGHHVVLVDLTEELLERARSAISRSLRFATLLGGRAEPGAAERIRASTDLRELAAADFLIESVTERLDVKLPLYPRLDAVCRPDVVLATSTSVLSVTRLATATRRPAQVIGVHFMDPVPLRPTVEVVRGLHTSDATLETTKALLADLGKQCVVVADSPGFVSNRVMMLAINEAAAVLQDGVAPAEDVDRIFRECFGHKMGPLETADLVGLDTVLLSLAGLEDALGDRFRPCALLQRLVEAGHLGRKSGRGFHLYE